MNRASQAHHQPTELFSVAIDGMDTTKTELPFSRARHGTTQKAFHLRVHLVGVLIHRRHPICFLDYHQYPHDSNLLINTFLQVRNNLSFHLLSFARFFTGMIILFNRQIFTILLNNKKDSNQRLIMYTLLWISLILSSAKFTPKTSKDLYSVLSVIIVTDMFSHFQTLWLHRDLLSDSIAIQLDNTAKENKNQYVFCFMGYLVEKKVFERVRKQTPLLYPQIF